uniref:t-SNARE coiled-coil homology domain-containing protein n=1 Tax=Rhabditophanes sp. KR3021 TaxID=114890 RepID=A0AC35TJZ5_9BILA
MGFSAVVAPFTDNTALFNAKMKMICAKRKKQFKENGVAEEGSEKRDRALEEASMTDKFKKTNWSLYLVDGKQILENISLLKKLALDNRTNYLASSGFYFPLSKADEARDVYSCLDRKKLDAETDIGLKKCQQLIESLRKRVGDDKLLRIEDEREVIKGVLVILDIYLNRVRGDIINMRESFNSKFKKAKQYGSYSGVIKMNKSAFENVFEQFKKEELSQILPKNQYKPSFNNYNELRERKSGTKPIISVTYNPEDEKVMCGSSEELRMENQMFYKKLTHKNEEIEMITSQFAEIDKLHQTFKDKVLNQDEQIEVVQQNTEFTEINMIEANDLIRKALQNNASRRVIFMFCILVLTLTIGFLNWFNP